MEECWVHTSVGLFSMWTHSHIVQGSGLVYTLSVLPTYLTLGYPRIPSPQQCFPRPIVLDTIPDATGDL